MIYGNFQKGHFKAKSHIFNSNLGLKITCNSHNMNHNLIFFNFFTFNNCCSNKKSRKSKDFEQNNTKKTELY